VIKYALTDISPLFFNAVRMSLAAVVLAVVFHRPLRGTSTSAIVSGVVIGLFLGVGNGLQTTGLKYTAASKSAFLTGLAVVLVPLFLAIFWKRKIGVWSAVGIAMAFAGLYLLTLPTTASRSIAGGMNQGDLLTLGAAIVFAFHIIFMGHATVKHRWQQIAVVQTATAALLMIGAFPLFERVHVVWSANVITGILITGLFSLAAAFSVQAWAQQFTPPTHTALIFSLEPVFAWLTSFLLLGERLGTRGAFGGALILAGVVMSEEKGSAESMAVAPDHAGVPPSGGA
jgi:drug/metabolite transporter (DMT)-like permease